MEQLSSERKYAVKYCWSYEDHTVNMMTAGVVLVSVLCLGSIVSNSLKTSDPLSYILMYSFAFAFLFSCPICIAWISARKYKLDSEGMLVSYPLGIKRHYKWSEFSEISLCKVHYASGSNAHVLAIRCVIGAEETGPSKAHIAREDWAKQEYEFLHFKNIISIYYTEARYAEFVENSPLPIKDYRYLKDTF